MKRPDSGHWRRDDGSGSFENAAPVVSNEEVFVFEDEQPLALTTSVKPTEEDKIAQILNVPLSQVHKLDIGPEAAKQLLKDLKDKAATAANPKK
jgi:hypothetical protein